MTVDIGERIRALHVWRRKSNPRRRWHVEQGYAHGGRKGRLMRCTGEQAVGMLQVRSSCDSTSSCLVVPRLAPQPFALTPLGNLSIPLRMTASQPSRPSSADRFASVSLAAPLVLIYALPAEIQRRRPPRRGTAALQAAGARAGRGIWHVLAPRRAAARIPRSSPARSLPDRRSGRRSSASGRPGRWPGSSLRSPLPPHRSALAHISMPAMEYVPRAACGASRAFCVRTLKLYHGCVLCEHVCPPCPDTYLDRHHTWSRRVLCEIIR